MSGPVSYQALPDESQNSCSKKAVVTNWKLVDTIIDNEDGHALFNFSLYL